MSMFLRTFTSLLLFFLVLVSDRVLLAESFESAVEDDLSLPGIRYHAFLIGIPNLSGQEVNTSIQATIPALAEVLQEKYGFNTQVLLGRNATGPAIEKRMRSYVETLTDRDFLLLVYVGATEKDHFLNESYWVTAPVSENEAYHRGGELWFSCNRVLKYTGAMEARHILLLNEGFFAWNKQRGIRINAKSDRPSNWYVQAAQQPSRTILTRPIEADRTDLFLLPRLTDILMKNESDFFAGADLTSRYRDLSGDPLHEFGRLFDFKGTLKGDFVFTLANRAYALADDLLSAKTSPTEQPVLSDTILSSVAERERTVDDVSVPFRASSRLHAEHALEVDFDQGNAEGEFGGVLVNNNGCQSTLDSVVGQGICFEHRSHLSVSDSRFRSLAEGDFSISFWVKRLNREDSYTHGSGIFYSGTMDRAISISLSEDGMITFAINGPTSKLRTGNIVFPKKLQADKWYFVVCSKRGDTISGSLNLEDMGSFVGSNVTFGNNSNVAYLGKSGNHEGDSLSFIGLLDEFSIYEHALNSQEMETLYRRKYERFGVSPVLAEDTENLDQIAKRSFGNRAKMADWRTIVSLFEGECEELMNTIGFKHWESAFVRCDGERIWKENRHYLVTRHSGAPRDYYLVHETLDDHQLDLGSWFHTSCKVLIQKY